MIATVLTVNGQELTGEGMSHCHARFYGRGIAADVSACGPDVPLQIRATTVEAQTLILHVTYTSVSNDTHRDRDTRLRSLLR
jgi:hypothetical protein